MDCPDCKAKLATSSEPCVCGYNKPIKRNLTTKLSKLGKKTFSSSSRNVKSSTATQPEGSTRSTRMSMASMIGTVSNARQAASSDTKSGGGKADVNAVVDADGSTALIQAASMGNTKLVKLLVEMMGADVNKLDNNGHSCLDVASVNGHTEVVSYLKPHFGLSPSSPKDEAQEESEDKEKTEEENKASILDRNVHPDRLTCAQLMDRVTHVDKGLVSEETRRIFWLQYPCFTSKEEVLAKLKEAYNSENDQSGEQISERTEGERRSSNPNPRLSLLSKMHIINLLLQWISDYPHDVLALNPQDESSWLYELSHPPSLEEMSTSVESTDYRAMFIRLKSLREDLGTALATLTSDEKEKEKDVPRPLFSPSSSMSGVGSAEDTSSPYHLRYLDQKAYTELKDKGVTSEEDIFSLSATVIAQQLCLMDFDEFNTIQPREFCNKGWTRKTAKETSPNILRLISIYNHRSNWAVYSILSATDINSAKSRLSKMLAVSMELFRYNNFFSCSAIRSGLNMTPVYRLRPCWEALSRKQEQAWDNMETLFNSQKNYNNYRQALREVQDQRDQHHIFNLPTLCKDMFQLEELDTLVKSEEGVVKINWNKFLKQNKALTSLSLMMTGGKYTFQADPVVELSIRESQREVEYKEDTMFERSYILVPKSERHTWLMNWKRMNMDQKTELLRQAQHELAQVLDPIEEQRAIRKAKEQRLREKEDEKLGPFQSEVDRILAVYEKDQKAEAIKQAAELKLRAEALERLSTENQVHMLSDGKLVEYTIEINQNGSDFSLLFWPTADDSELGGMKLDAETTWFSNASNGGWAEAVQSEEVLSGRLEGLTEGQFDVKQCLTIIDGDDVIDLYLGLDEAEALCWDRALQAVQGAGKDEVEAKQDEEES